MTTIWPGTWRLWIKVFRTQLASKNLREVIVTHAKLIWFWTGCSEDLINRHQWTPEELVAVVRTDLGHEVATAPAKKLGVRREETPKKSSALAAVSSTVGQLDLRRELRWRRVINHLVSA